MARLSARAKSEGNNGAVPAPASLRVLKRHAARPVQRPPGRSVKLKPYGHIKRFVKVNVTERVSVVSLQFQVSSPVTPAGSSMAARPKCPFFNLLLGSAFAIELVLSATAAFSQNAVAAASGPFNSLAGLWSGNGVVDTSDGLHEHVRCKATYVAEKAGYTVRLDLRCASDAYNFELTSNIVQTGDSLSGNWFENSHRVGGSISGHNDGHQIEARAEGDTFTALLTVRTSGRRQSFLMESPGAKVSQVSISLNQSAK
jgi:hypothetical protein